MKYVFPLLALVLCTACEPLVTPGQPQVVVPGTQGEEISEGETEAAPEQELGTRSIVERLLPSGFIEVGNREAPLVVMVYTEHHCRYCKDFHSDHFPKLYKDFIEPGDVRLQIGIFPLKKYEHSERAAVSLTCAAQQGKGIPMHNFLLEVGVADQTLLLKHATAIELDTGLFTECLENPDTLASVERQKSMARSLNVTLVPTFFIDGEKSVGLPYYADFKAAIQQKL